MKFYLFILILSSTFLFSKCDDDFDYHDYEGNPDNINIESISYELTYSNHSVVKVVIKTYDEIESDISFIAYLKSNMEQKEYKLNCSSTFYDIIECLSDRNVEFNLNDNYYFYYNKTKSKFTFDENDVLEDDKQVSLIFKPDITIEDKLYKDKRKIIAETHGSMVGGGYLYIAKKSKEVLNKPKDGFNKFIELNNFIPKIGSYNGIPISTLLGYKKAIKRGYHIVEAILRFTKDNIPVVSHEEDLEKITNKKGKISNYTYSELLKVDFGQEIDEKYKGERILNLHSLLELCKDFDVILDLDISHLETKKYFGDDNSYANKIINAVKQADMFDSVFFSDGPNFRNVLKLKKIKKDIAISVTTMNTIESYDKIKNELNGSRIIFNSGELSYENTLKEETIKYGSSLGNKMKAGTVDDINYARKIQSWGINLISTKTLPSFLIENEKEDPIMVRCVPVDDDHSECDIEDDIILKDNEWYYIYYSDNIYNISQDINQDPIGEFQYSDTNILDELYYKINEFNYERGIINLNLSQKLKTGDEIYGIVGPEYDDVPECYQYTFVCPGHDGYTVNCRIEKEEDKVEYNGKYCIYALEDYSLNEFETEERTEPQETYYEFIVEKKNYSVLICCIIIVLVICGFIIYYVKCRKPTEDYDRVRITDNNYMSDNYLYR